MAAEADFTTSPDPVKYYHLANAAFARLLQHLPAEEQAHPGGTFTLTDPDGIPYFAFQLGDPPRGRRQGRWDRAQEKCRRAAHGKCTSSRDTRDPDIDRWGGSLQGDISERLGGFSGLPEEDDEILVVDTLVRAGDMSAVQGVSFLMGNEHFKKLSSHYDWANGPGLL